MGAVRSTRGTRVFVEDTRGNGAFLRMTWHRDDDVFVISNWEGDVCVAATRVAVDDAPAVIGLLSEGLVDAATRPRPAAPTEPRSLVEHLRAWWVARRRQAVVIPIRRSTGRVRHRRSA